MKAPQMVFSKVPKTLTNEKAGLQEYDSMTADRLTGSPIFIPLIPTRESA